ncbi:hypothetical protein ASG65_20795 [Bacillus sp. Leaf13]|nr:hypothetical protein ASG65_20795 [Bacillus sp. Leaf13]
MSWNGWELLITSLVTLVGVFLGSWWATRGTQKLQNEQTKTYELKTNFILIRNIRSIQNRLDRLQFFYEAEQQGAFQDFGLNEDLKDGLEKVEYFMGNIDSLDYHHFSMKYIAELQDFLHSMDKLIEESHTYLKYNGMDDYHSQMDARIEDAKQRTKKLLGNAVLLKGEK